MKFLNPVMVKRQHFSVAGGFLITRNPSWFVPARLSPRLHGQMISVTKAKYRGIRTRQKKNHDTHTRVAIVKRESKVEKNGQDFER